jgi:hypothetical protein
MLLLVGVIALAVVIAAGPATAHYGGSGLGTGYHDAWAKSRAIETKTIPGWDLTRTETKVQGNWWLAYNSRTGSTEVWFPVMDASGSYCYVQYDLVDTQANHACDGTVHDWSPNAEEFEVHANYTWTEDYPHCSFPGCFSYGEYDQYLYVDAFWDGSWDYYCFTYGTINPDWRLECTGGLNY